MIPAALEDNASTQAMLVPGGRLYEQREATMREIAKIDGLSCVKNHGAFYVFPKLDVKKFNITSDKQFAFDFLHEKHIFIVPGLRIRLAEQRPFPHRDAAGTGGDGKGDAGSRRLPQPLQTGLSRQSFVNRLN